MSNWAGTPEQEIETLREMVERRDERITELEQCLREARENLEDWGMYASEYFRDKHGIAEDLAAIDRVLGGGDER